jgi:hypothetical protein
MGATRVWDKISSSDLDQAKNNLDLRRTEAMNRHAKEIEALNAEESEVNQLEAAIEAFVQKQRK